jgi:hypothetical protein
MSRSELLVEVGRQWSEKAEVIVITKIMPYSGTNGVFTGSEFLSSEEPLPFISA